MSTLHAELDRYLTVRRALGFKLARAELLLAECLRYLDTIGADTVTTDNTFAWATLPATGASSWWGHRLWVAPITWASSGARCATGSTCSGLARRPPLMARRPAAPSSPPAPRPARCRRRAVRRGPLEGQTPEQRIAGLKSRVAELEAETTKLTTEREASLVDPLAFHCVGEHAFTDDRVAHAAAAQRQAWSSC